MRVTKKELEHKLAITRRMVMLLSKEIPRLNNAGSEKKAERLLEVRDVARLQVEARDSK